MKLGGGGNGNNLSWELRFEREAELGLSPDFSVCQLFFLNFKNCISLHRGRNGNNLSQKLRFEADGGLSGSHLVSGKSRRAVGVLTGPPLLLLLFVFVFVFVFVFAFAFVHTWVFGLLTGSLYYKLIAF